MSMMQWTALVHGRQHWISVKKKKSLFFLSLLLVVSSAPTQPNTSLLSHLHIIVAARDFVIRKFIIYFVIFLCFPLSWFERLKTVIPLRSVESFRFISSFPLFGMELCVSSFIAAQPILSLYFAFHTLIHQHIRCLHFSGVATNSTSTKHTEKRFSFFAFLITSCECVVFVFSVFSFILLRSFCCCFVWLLCASHQCVCVCRRKANTHDCMCMCEPWVFCMLNASHTLHFHSIGVRDRIVSCLLRSFEFLSISCIL